MITPYLAQQPVDDFGLPFPGLKYNALLAAGANEHILIPSNAQRYKIIMYAQLGSVLVSVNNLVDVPLSPTFVSTNAEVIPFLGYLCREVKAGNALYFYNFGSDVSLVQVVLYSMGQTN